MRMTAEQLRSIDEERFRALISRIEECLRRDANWTVETALSSLESEIWERKRSRK
jgi:hypothetical protein